MRSSNSKESRPGERLPLCFSMFSSPGKTLASLRKLPIWFLPLLLAAGCATAANFYVILRVGFVRLIGAALKTNAVIDPQAVMDGVLARKSLVLFLQGISTFAGTFLTAIIVARVLWLLLQIVGEDIFFKSVLAVVAHVTMLMVVIRGSMLALTATVMRNPDNLDLRNPLATNPAFFFHHASPVVSRLLASLDLITFANIALLAFGLNRVSKRLSLGAACVVVITPWTIYTCITALLSSLV